MGLISIDVFRPVLSPALAMVQIVVENQGLESYVLDVELTDTLRCVKLVVEDMTGIPADAQQMQHLGHEGTIVPSLTYDLPELQDNGTLDSYGISDGSVLYLSQEEEIRVFVKPLRGQTLEIPMVLSAPLLLLKQKIAAKEGPLVLVDHQRLIFQGRQLGNDDAPLSFHQIQNGSTLHLVLRLRGGGGFVRYAAVLHPWDGDMRHPGVNGLQLTPQTIVVVEHETDENWYIGRHLGSTSESNGIFPKAYVEILRPVADENGTVADVPPLPLPQPTPGPIPALPAYYFPYAFPMSHTFKFADRGKSWVKISVAYVTDAPPDAVTAVKVEITCWPLPSYRHINGIEMKITVEDNTVTAITPVESWQGPATLVHVKKNVVRGSSRNFTSSCTAVFKYLTCGLTSSSTRTVEEEIEISAPAAVEVSEGVRAAIIEEDSASWAISEVETPHGRGLEGAVVEDAKMSFSLSKKPVRFNFECTVVHQGPGTSRVRSPTMSSRSRTFPFWSH
ncbi:hypothetical protein C8F01DRAFT_1171450 [Mycena amicta]|nr:hypothetical protein C8F01DRAFT_1171450 [Mycena amicta]